VLQTQFVQASMSQLDPPCAVQQSPPGVGVADWAAAGPAELMRSATSNMIAPADANAVRCFIDGVKTKIPPPMKC
jgi:hypothetical protein